jgi:hypothetical protein
MSEEPMPTASYEPIDTLRISHRYLENQRRMRESRDVTEQQVFENILERIEEIVGPLLDWQKVYAYAAISGRGVEWAQTRGSSHYHIVGLPCAICGRG